MCTNQSSQHPVREITINIILILISVLNENVCFKWRFQQEVEIACFYLKVL